MNEVKFLLTILSIISIYSLIRGIQSLTLLRIKFQDGILKTKIYTKADPYLITYSIILTVSEFLLANAGLSETSINNTASLIVLGLIIFYWIYFLVESYDFENIDIELVQRKLDVYNSDKPMKFLVDYSHIKIYKNLSAKLFHLSHFVIPKLYTLYFWIITISQ